MSCDVLDRDDSVLARGVGPPDFFRPLQNFQIGFGPPMQS